MPNTEYQACMTQAMRGFPKGLSREERGRLFCIEAKLCSGKFNNRAAAEKDCIEHPATPKASSGRRSRGIDSMGIAQCLLPMLQNQTVSVKELSAWISECSGKSAGVKIKKPQSKNNFLKVCVPQLMLEQGLKGTFAESIRLRKQCEAKWQEKQATEATSVQ